MIGSKTSRKIKLSIAIVFFLIIIIYFRLERQRQFATAKVLNAISEMEKSWNSSVSTLLEPATFQRCQRSGHGLFLLVMVMSDPSHLEQRRVIRSTWAEMRDQWEAEFLRENQNQFEVTQVIRLLFFLGQPRGHISNDIQDEWDKNGDLVIDDFQESYLTLTLKTLRMLRWATLNCSGARYVTKLDDDVFVHVPKLLKRLSDFSENQGERLRVILGYVVNGPQVYRDPFSKFFTPRILYSRENYPNHLSGICYVLGMGAAQEIVDLLEGPRSEDLKLFHMEDVFVTGIVANERLGIPLLEISPALPNFYFEVDSKSLTFDPDQDLDPNKKTKSLQWVLQHVIIHKVTSEQIRCWTKLTGQGQRSLAAGC